MRGSGQIAEQAQAGSRSLTAVIDRFDSAWQGDPPPSIEAFLDEFGPFQSPEGRTKLLLELVAVDLEQCWRRSREGDSQQRPRIEDYVRRFPELAPGGQVPLTLLVEEYRVRRRWGDQPGQDEYLARFPHCREALPHELSRVDRELGSGPPTTDVATLANANAESTVDRPIRAADRIRAGAGVQLPPAIGRYAIRKVLGEGAFGAVYLAHDSALNRLVALKVPRGDWFTGPEQIEQFIAEARTAAQLRHPRIVAVHDIDRQPDGTPVVILDYIDGPTLKSVLDSQALTPRCAAELMAEVADAVAEAHRKGFVHRDLKPANILLDSDGKPHVADFGLALHEDAQRERPGEFAGTVAYMAPEQVRGESHRLDGRADIWALGVILYEMLTARLPFGGNSTKQLADEIQNRDPKPPRQIDPSIPVELEAVIAKCCAKNVNARYSTAADIAEDLKTWLSSLDNPGPWVRPVPHRGPSWIGGQRGVKPIRRSAAMPQWRTCGKPLLRTFSDGWQLAAVVAIAMAIGGIVIWKLGGNMKSTSGGPSPSNAAGDSAATPTNSNATVSTLKVTAIEVTHFARSPDGDVLKGVLGRESFSATLGDSVQVTARLSKPGYAFLIAFRPDGPPDLCFPESEDIPPPQSDAPRYPSVNRLEAYELAEGTGLWAFAVIASEKPLPPYKEVKAQIEQQAVWKALKDIPPTTVWWDDGDARIEQLTPTGPGNATRGKGAFLRGPAEAIVQLTETLRTAGTDSTSAIGFAVAPRK
jgi:serine/threonine protein kinase